MWTLAIGSQGKAKAWPSLLMETVGGVAGGWMEAWWVEAAVAAAETWGVVGWLVPAVFLVDA